MIYIYHLFLFPPGTHSLWAQTGEETAKLQERNHERSSTT